MTFSQTNGIPFRIEGTTSNPVFRPDIGAAVTSGLADAAKDPENVKKAADFLGGLFGHK